MNEVKLTPTMAKALIQLSHGYTTASRNTLYALLRRGLIRLGGGANDGGRGWILTDAGRETLKEMR